MHLYPHAIIDHTDPQKKEGIVNTSHPDRHLNIDTC
jgi:hypothetical protein